MKKMFHRIGAMALAFMLALSLAAPVMAAETPRATLTINEAIPDVTYRIIQLMELEMTGDAGGDGTSYSYTLADGALGEAVRAVIAGSEFEAQLSIDKKTVTRNGFQLANDGLVVFRVATEVGQGVPAAYEAWAGSVAGQTFMSRFADAVKAKVEATKDAEGHDVTALVSDANVKKVKDNGAADAANGFVADTNPAGKTIGVELEYGYYMVISGAGQRAVICTNPAGDAVINEKNDAPKLTKQVSEPALGDGKHTDKSDASIGDLVYYQAVIDAGTGLNHLKFKDTLSKGLTFVALTNVDFFPRTVVGEGANAEGKVLYGPGTDGTFTGNKADNREFYCNSMNGVTSKADGGGSLLPATEDPRFDWNDADKPEDLSGITLKNGLRTINIDADLADNMVDKDGAKVKDGQVLTIDFAGIWLQSKRSSSSSLDQSTNRDDYKFDPIYPKDNRLKTTDGEGNVSYATNDAMYNQYLGDMSTTLDDGGKIVINYVARINSEAEIGGDGNKNTAVLEYGNDPTNEPITVETPEQKTSTYVYELDVLKYMAGDKGTKLAGAKFELRRASLDLRVVNEAKDTITVTANDIKELEGESAIPFVKLGDRYVVKNNADPLFVKQEDGNYREKTDSDTGVTLYMKVKDEYGEVTTELVSDANGSIKLQGLDADLYSLTETEAPAGYIKAEEPMYAVLGSTATGTAGVGGVASCVYVRSKTAGEENLFKAATKTVKNENNIDVTVRSNEVEVENASGIQLPTTGGIGTTIFYVVGVVLVAGAGVLLVVRKRTGGSK